MTDGHFITLLLQQWNPEVCEEDYANLRRKVQIHLICINLLAKQGKLNRSTLCTKQNASSDTPLSHECTLSLLHILTVEHSQRETHMQYHCLTCTSCSHIAFLWSKVYYYQHKIVIMLLTAL